MRLTLRTLLAYLDHTLDPADEANLKEKVKTSTIASALVSRIEGVMKTRTVSSPAADAAAPNDDANTVAEYLDSTLAPELTADIERRCLESDGHLAEVAATHSVLAAALSEPSIVPADLRRRIYELKPDGAGDGNLGNGNGTSTAPGIPVPPVGPEDSGVSKATTRLSDEPDYGATLAAASKSIRKNRRAEKKAESNGTAVAGVSSADQTLAGSRTRQELEAIEPLLSGGRSARVVPWLVTLALAAAFLFVLTKAFRPLIDNGRLADKRSEGSEDVVEPDIAGTNGDVSLIPEPLATERTPKTNSSSTKPVVTSPVTPPSLVSESEKTEAATESGGNRDKPPAKQSDLPKSVTEVTTDEKGGRVDGMAETKAENGVGVGQSSPKGSESPNNSGNELQNGPPTLFDPASLLDSVSKSEADQSATEMEASSSPVIGGVQSHGGLLLTQRIDAATGLGSWERISQDSQIVSEQVIYCPPAYRSRVVLDGGVELGLVGPVSIRVERKRELGGRLGLTIDSGRLTVMATREPASVWIANPVVTGFVDLATSGAMAAIEIRHRRLPGRSIEHSSWKTDLLVDSIAGRVQLRLHDDADPGNDAVLKLGVGQQVRETFGQSAEVRTVSTSPTWIDSALAEDSLAESKSTLARLINNDDPVELSMIRATEYRDIKVAGLAARTLANMGVVYQFFGTADNIGPTGLLNQPQHRLNWPELVRSLQQLFDRGERSAESIAYAANLREGEADAAKVVRMLQGFTQDELDSGDAAILVAFLDDPKLAVRVIAIEVLRQITGETLDYKPEVETANLRRASVNRWKNYVREDRVKYRKQS